MFAVVLLAWNNPTEKVASSFQDAIQRTLSKHASQNIHDDTDRNGYNYTTAMHTYVIRIHEIRKVHESNVRFMSVLWAKDIYNNDSNINTEWKK